MRMKPVTIVGGGLAGLTLGIGLRQRDVPVTVWEAGHYPRHRVCGEFISGHGQETLSRLGLREVIERAGAIRANTAAFFSATKSTPPRPLPAGAVCISRFTLDHVLAGEFQKLDGELIENKRWQSDELGEGIVRATGRRLQPEANGTRWFGLKIHARNVSLAADLEMHLSLNGYVGLCRVNDGTVNICGLFQREAKGDMAIISCRNEPTPYPSKEGNDVRGHLRGETGSLLNERLMAAEFDESSFCAVAGLSLRPQRADSRREFSLGDAITMIPPMTGNGMSMAFESAETAIDPVIAWSRGELAWNESQESFARQCDGAFRRRLIWAKWLQQLALTPRLQNIFLNLYSSSGWCRRVVFERTR